MKSFLKVHREVISRELNIWHNRPIYIIGSVLVMIVCSIFYLTFMKEGVPSDVPIGVVDYDNSSLTRNFIQQLDATQLGKVVRYPDFASARKDMQRGKITSVCLLPEGMYADVQAQRQPKITFYINSLYFLGGSLAYKDLLTMVNLTSGAVQRQALRLRGMNEKAIIGKLRPFDVDVHMIGNPTMNYGAYLANMMLPGMLQMVIVILIIYSLGAELKYSRSRELMQITEGSITRALGGKLALYTLLFTALGASLIFLLYGWMRFPLAGSIWWMLLDVLLLVLASEAIGVLIISTIPVLRFALSIGALYCVMSLSMAGFSLPVEAMPAGIQGIACIFPLRHYYQMFVQCGIYDTGMIGCYREIIHLLVFQIAPFAAARNLKSAYFNMDYPKK